MKVNAHNYTAMNLGVVLNSKFGDNLTFAEKKELFNLVKNPGTPLEIKAETLNNLFSVLEKIRKDSYGHWLCDESTDSVVRMVEEGMENASYQPTRPLNDHLAVSLILNNLEGLWESPDMEVNAEVADAE